MAQVVSAAQVEGERLRALWRAQQTFPTPRLAEEAAAFLNLAEAARTVVRILGEREERGQA